MPVSKPESLEATANCVRVATARHCPQRLFILFDFFSFFCWGRRVLLGDFVTLALNPACKLVEGLLWQRQFLSSKELGHLCVDNLACVTETRFVLVVVAAQMIKLQFQYQTKSDRTKI